MTDKMSSQALYILRRTRRLQLTAWASNNGGRTHTFTTRTKYRDLRKSKAKAHMPVATSVEDDRYAPKYSPLPLQPQQNGEQEQSMAAGIGTFVLFGAGVGIISRLLFG